MGVERSLNLPGRSLVVAPINLHRYLAVTVLALLSVAAILVVARRLVGALANPLEPTTLLITGIVVAAAGAAIRLGWRWPSAETQNPRFERTVMMLTSLAVVALGASLCLPGTPALGLFFLCTLLGAEESWAWAWYIRQCSETNLEVLHTVRVDTAHAAPPRAGRGNTPSHAITAIEPETGELPEDVTQQLTRSHAADGTDELSGWLRLAFASGQRTGSLHVAFCPPFAAVPELEVEQVDGPESRIKTAQLLPYGVRLDLKLSAAAEEPTNVLLQFSARTT